jgi:hypothetical protein
LGSVLQLEDDSVWLLGNKWIRPLGEGNGPARERKWKEKKRKEWAGEGCWAARVREKWGRKKKNC